MAKPDVEITPGQRRIMQKLILSHNNATERLRAAQEMATEEIASMEEYAAQMAEKFGLDLTADYSFDIAKLKFVDKASVKP